MPAPTPSTDLRHAEALQPSAASRAFADLLRDDLLPFAEIRFGAELKELGSFLQGHLHLDAARFHGLFRTTTEQVQELRQLDPNFDRVLASMDAEAPGLPAERLLFSRAVLDLLEIWPHPKTPSLSADMRRLLTDLARRCKRFEVISALRDRIFPVSERGFRTVTQVQGQVVQLSNSTRPFDFTSPGVLPSVVRRYGLLYDLVEFTQLIEELRRRGRGTEEQAMRQMVRFLGRVDEIRERHRLRFEKFLGDGAFYSARSARGIFLAAAELRLLYERMRKQGFPFDRGLRLAMNVGTYHLLPMFSAAGDRSHFEFFGHGLVELARLTTGKTTHEVEDITDFLIAAGYDLNRVLQFLEPVRHANRFTEFIKDRPVRGVHRGERRAREPRGRRDRELPARPGGRLGRPARRAGRAVRHALAAARHRPRGRRGPVGGPARARHGAAEGTGAHAARRGHGLRAAAAGRGPGREGHAAAAEPAAALERRARCHRARVRRAPRWTPHLCVASVLEDEATRSWYIGKFEDEVEALANAFRVKLAPVGLKDGEPFESWLFQHRADLAKLYQGLRRQSSGATVPLEDLRRRDGYFTCLLATPHRSPR